mgnify:CR=1 FL=1
MVFALAWPPLLVVGCYRGGGRGGENACLLNLGERSMKRLRKRRDFVRVRETGKKVGGRFLSLQIVLADPELRNGALCRVGFTATKRLRNAVERNRARRRMRVLATTILSEYAVQGLDCVLLARKPILEARFSDLIFELRTLLERVQINALPTENGVVKE